jgi:hypothetical protein
MLSATPVNNRMADLRNQIAFATEGDDMALLEQGISSIDSTTRLAQKQFNRWLDLEDAERTPPRLIEMLGFDYFTLLDLLTIARSRKHVEKYYGTAETGRFPDRLKPINIKADVDLAGQFRPIRDINLEIRRLNLAAYAPLRYVLPHKQPAYDAKYSTEIRGGEGFFRQADREESLIHLLRVNVLKRMESAVTSFALTLQRQLRDVEATLALIEAHTEELEEIDIDDVDIDDPAYESLLVGRKVKVLLNDVDLIRWKQDLIEDRNRLATLHAAASQVNASRDAKLAALREEIETKCRYPINPRQPEGHRLHSVRRHGALSLPATRPLGEGEVRHRCRAGDRHRPQPDHAFGAAQGPGFHPHSLRAPLEGAPGGARRRRRARPAHRDGLHL